MMSYDKMIERVVELMDMPERSSVFDKELDELVRTIEIYEAEIIGDENDVDD